MQPIEVAGIQSFLGKWGKKSAVTSSGNRLRDQIRSLNLDHERDQNGSDQQNLEKFKSLTFFFQKSFECEFSISLCNIP